MLRRSNRLLVSALLFLIFAQRGVGNSLSEAEIRDRENLRTFARVYGYVRFFHPSDEASSVNWDALGIVGAERCRNAKDISALRESLLTIFQPIAPTMRLTITEDSSATPSPSYLDLNGTGSATTFWQYKGIKFSGREVIYRQQRAIVGNDRFTGQQPLFKPQVSPGLLVELVAPAMVLSLPMALPVDDFRKTSPGVSDAFKRL